MFQSTRPHGARPTEYAKQQGYFNVSIHAPTRGATLREAVRLQIWLVSIHAPTRGATQFEDERANCVKFQSTRPHGARLRVAHHRAVRVLVSIHAPTRGATRERRRKIHRAYVSIHAPTRGATVHCTCSFPATFCFNPRAHTGRDAKVSHKLLNITSFNPRAHTGRDTDLVLLAAVLTSFNPRAHTGRDSIFSKRLNICIQNYTFCETWQTYTQNCFY